jgi:hypothetical protein
MSGVHAQPQWLISGCYKVAMREVGRHKITVGRTHSPTCRLSVSIDIVVSAAAAYTLQVGSYKRRQCIKYVQNIRPDARKTKAVRQVTPDKKCLPPYCSLQILKFLSDSLTGSLDFYEMNMIYFSKQNKLQVSFPTTQFCQFFLLRVRLICTFAANWLKSSNAYCSVQLFIICPYSLTPVNFPTTNFCHKCFDEPAESLINQPSGVMLPICYKVALKRILQLTNVQIFPRLPIIYF